MFTADVLARFDEKYTQSPDGCWLWNACRTRDGYGHLRVGGKMKRAHRIAYERAHGPIPAGMTVDHTCFHRSCVHPDHLRLLTHEENARNQRSSFKDQCVNGHTYSAENTYWRPSGRRDCRQCISDRVAAYRLRRAA